MKKLMTMMLGLSLALGCVAVSFAQDTTTTKKSSKKRPPRKRSPTHQELVFPNHRRIAPNAIRRKLLSRLPRSIPSSR